MKKMELAAVTMCAGAPLRALGVGTATAWADTNTATDTINALQRIDPNDVAISFSGIPLVKTGNSTADSSGPSLAIASNNSRAYAHGVGNLAIATNNSSAAANFPYHYEPSDLNTAIADNNSGLIAGAPGNGNTAIARNGSTAVVIYGDFNTVRATNNSDVYITTANTNTVTASDGSNVEFSGDANTVTARCGGSVLYNSDADFRGLSA